METWFSQYGFYVALFLIVCVMFTMANITDSIFSSKVKTQSVTKITTKPLIKTGIKRKRFLISTGINDFARNSSVSLKGCEADCKNYVNFCVSRGFSETYCLMGENATLLAFENLTGDIAKLATVGDRVVIHISSHGCQINDKFNDELDGKTEATCFYDFMDGGLMTDNHFNQILSKFENGVLIEVTKDTCNSRDSTRFAAFTEDGIPIDPAKLPRSRGLTPSDMVGVNLTKILAERKVIVQSQLRVAEDSACLEDQTAADVFNEDTQEYGGAFTISKLKALQMLPHDATVSEISAVTNRLLKEAGYEQISTCQIAEGMDVSFYYFEE
jgi:hypothetical protein